MRRVYSYRIERVRANNPKSLTENRKTVPEICNPIAPQSCSLLSRLPIEIRLQIWRLVLGNRVFQIQLHPGCQGSPIYVECIEGDGHCHTYLRSEDLHKDEHPRNNFSLMSLPRTCRQAHWESIDLLYSSNTFDISNFIVLKYFVQGVPRAGLSLIRSLRIRSRGLSGLPGACIPHSGFDCPCTMFWRVALDELKGLKTVDIMMCSADAQNFSLDLAARAFFDRAEKVVLLVRNIGGDGLWIGEGKEEGIKR